MGEKHAQADLVRGSGGLGLVTAGPAAAGTADVDSAGSGSAAPTVIDVTSVSQIPTAGEGLAASPAGNNAIFRLIMTNNEGGQCLDGDADTARSPRVRQARGGDRGAR